MPVATHRHLTRSRSVVPLAPSVPARSAATRLHFSRTIVAQAILPVRRAIEVEVVAASFSWAQLTLFFAFTVGRPATRALRHSAIHPEAPRCRVEGLPPASASPAPVT
jgi:hypothetical protein